MSTEPLSLVPAYSAAHGGSIVVASRLTRRLADVRECITDYPTDPQKRRQLETRLRFPIVSHAEQCETASYVTRRCRWSAVCRARC